MANILANLAACYGADRVVDVFENTGMAQKAKDLNIGCYVVRGVLTSAQLEAWHEALTDSVSFIANTNGTRAVDLKGNRSGAAAHRTIQCVAGICTCKYDYAATARHKLWKTSDVKPFSVVCDWLHDVHKVDRWEYFDEIVANIYDRRLNPVSYTHLTLPTNREV